MDSRKLICLINCRFFFFPLGVIFTFRAEAFILEVFQLRNFSLPILIKPRKLLERFKKKYLWLHIRYVLSKLTCECNWFILNDFYINTIIILSLAEFPQAYVLGHHPRGNTLYWYYFQSSLRRVIRESLPSYFALRALLPLRAASFAFPPAVTFLASVEASWCSLTFSSSLFFPSKICLRGSYAGCLLPQPCLILPCLPLIAACLLAVPVTFCAQFPIFWISKLVLVMWSYFCVPSVLL